MKRIISLTAGAGLLCWANLAGAADVSIGIGIPLFAPPPVVYAAPPVVYAPAPVYEDDDYWKHQREYQKEQRKYWREYSKHYYGWHGDDDDD